MGGGIAEVAAKSGFDVTACEVTDEFLEKGEARIRKSMERAVQMGNVAGYYAVRKWGTQQ